MSALDWGLDPRTWVSYSNCGLDLAIHRGLRAYNEQNFDYNCLSQAVVPVLVGELSECVPDPSADVLLDSAGRPLLDVEVCGVVDSAKEATSYREATPFQQDRASTGSPNLRRPALASAQPPPQSSSS